jgi:hypothetical protein
MEMDNDEEDLTKNRATNDEEGDSMGESEPEEAMNMTWKELCGLKKTELLAVAEQFLDATAKETFDPAWTKTPMAAFLTEHKMPRAKCTTLVMASAPPTHSPRRKHPRRWPPKLFQPPSLIILPPPPGQPSNTNDATKSMSNSVKMNSMMEA